MPKLKGFSYKLHCDFLRAYGFKAGNFNGSHHFFYGRISGEDRVVQVIYNNHEKKSQSNRTMDMSAQNSGIPKKLYIEWKDSGTVDDSIIC